MESITEELLRALRNADDIQMFSDKNEDKFIEEIRLLMRISKQAVSDSRDKRDSVII